jgi:hypothetical protein
MSTELIYNSTRQCWEGNNHEDSQRIWMDDMTFRRYVMAYLEVQGIDQPTQKELSLAVSHCRQWSYWQGCTDPAVHWITAGAQVKRKYESSQIFCGREDAGFT